MKSVFRSLRLKFLGEGRVGRYLGYAIGEVLLIIIGILIALQISGWNGERQAQVEFDRYIEQLIGDVKTAIDLNREVSDSYIRRAKDHHYMIVFLETTEYQAEELALFEERLNALGRTHEPQIEIGLLAELFQGDTSIIRRNEELYEETLARIGELKINLNITHRVQAAIETSRNELGAYRAIEHERLPDLSLRYDLDHLRSSTDFTYGIQNIASQMMIVSSVLDGMIEDLEEYLAILEAYARKDEE